MGTKEYHAQKSREYYQRRSQDPAWLAYKTEYHTEKRRAKKAAAVERFGSLCAHCGRNYPDAVFEFHHRHETAKSGTPAKLFGLRDTTINDELDKCVMLCANCHRMEHIRRGYAAHDLRYL
jgi:predicted HNH restriction endonuclease